jgi:hypothetical protein
VLAIADDRCRRHAPSQVLLNRLGRRAWGGIGLAAALVLTLSAMTGNPREVRAVAARGESGAPNRAAVVPGAERGGRCHLRRRIRRAVRLTKRTRA